QIDRRHREMNDVRRDLRRIAGRLHLARALRDEAQRLSDPVAVRNYVAEIERLTAEYKLVSKRSAPVKLMTDLQLLAGLRRGALDAAGRGQHFEAADLRRRADVVAKRMELQTRQDRGEIVVLDRRGDDRPRTAAGYLHRSMNIGR